MYVALDGLT